MLKYKTGLIGNGRPDFTELINTTHKALKMIPAASSRHDNALVFLHRAF